MRCEQEAGGGRDVYTLPLPAVVTVLEGLNLPRYPSVPGRMRAKSKPVAASTPARPASRLERVRLVVPEGKAKQAEVLGTGARRRAAPSSTCSSRSGWPDEPRADRSPATRRRCRRITLARGRSAARSTRC